MEQYRHQLLALQISELPPTWTNDPFVGTININVTDDLTAQQKTAQTHDNLNKAKQLASYDNITRTFAIKSDTSVENCVLNSFYSNDSRHASLGKFKWVAIKFTVLSYGVDAKLCNGDTAISENAIEQELNKNNNSLQHFYHKFAIKMENTTGA